MKIYKYKSTWGTITPIYLRKETGGYIPEGQFIVQAYEAETHEPWMTISMYPGEDDKCKVKNYSENEGIVDFLLKNKIATLVSSGLDPIMEFDFNKF